MDMANHNAVSRMENVLFLYHKILRRNGVAWILEENPKIAERHVLSAVCSHVFKNRLHVDLKFSRAKLKKDLKGFLIMYLIDLKHDKR